MLATMRQATPFAVVLAACAAEPVEVGSVESALDLSVFELPALGDQERAAIVRDYDRLDPEDLVPRGLLEDAIVYFDVNSAHIPNLDHFVVVDLSLFSGKDRFWLVDVASGAVEPHKVAHGDGSDPDHDGYATMFSNAEGSHKSSLGFALTGEIYDGTHAHSMRLDGLSADGSPNQMANTNMRDRLVVVHEASYVDDDNTAKQGRSNGCPALDPTIEVSVVDRIHGGALFYIAISPLAAPVGRASCGDESCDGDETPDTCAIDCSSPADDPGEVPPVEPPPPAEAGGCSTTENGGLLIALAVLGLVFRRRHTIAA
jgi:uncharacterized protein (TIGR03382 family)